MADELGGVLDYSLLQLGTCGARVASQPLSLHEEAWG
jgi:hypothetical protein